MSWSVDKGLRGQAHKWKQCCGPHPQPSFLAPNNQLVAAAGSAIRLQMSCCWNPCCQLNFVPSDMTESSSDFDWKPPPSYLHYPLMSLANREGYLLLAYFFTCLLIRGFLSFNKVMVRAQAGKNNVHKNYQKLFCFCQSKQITESFCFPRSVSVFHQNQKMRHLICKFFQELNNIHSNFLRFLLSICVAVNNVVFPYLFGWRKNISITNHPFPPSFLPERWKALPGCNSTVAVLPTWKIVRATNLRQETNEVVLHLGWISSYHEDRHDLQYFESSGWYWFHFWMQ